MTGDVAGRAVVKRNRYGEAPILVTLGRDGRWYSWCRCCRWVRSFGSWRGAFDIGLAHAGLHHDGDRP